MKFRGEILKRYNVCSFCPVSIDVLCWPHRHEHRTVICSTQLGDAVKEDGGHLLVLVLYKAEYFKGEAAHLALAIFKDGGLGIFFTAGSEEGKIIGSIIRKESERNIKKTEQEHRSVF